MDKKDSENEQQTAETVANVPAVIEEELKKLPKDFTGTIEIPINANPEAVSNFANAKPNQSIKDELSEFESILWGGNAPADMPVVNYGDEYVVVKGEALRDGEKQADIKDIIDAIRTVSDPEIMINVYDLGLVYRMDRLVNGDVEIDMTVTAPSCPVAGLMPNQVAEAVSAVAGVGKVTVKLVWEPAWSVDRLSEEAKFALDLS